jgi:uncharacterized membrane protein
MMRKAQRRAESMLEAATNVSLGFVLALLTQAAAYPFFGIHTTLQTDTAIAVIFTLVSLARSYVVRRLFERAATEQGVRHARS